MLNDRGPKEIFRPKCGMGFTICRFYFRIDFCLICAFSCIQLGIFPNKLFNYVIFCSSSINSTIVECRSQWTKVCKSFFFASSIQSIVLGKIILTEVKKPFPDQITLSWNVIPHACANAEGIYRHMVKTMTHIFITTTNAQHVCACNYEIRNFYPQLLNILKVLHFRKNFSRNKQRYHAYKCVTTHTSFSVERW